jgi:hypothetical protein
MHNERRLLDTLTDIEADRLEVLLTARLARLEPPST